MIKDLFENRVILHDFPVFINRDFYEGLKIKSLSHCTNECFPDDFQNVITYSRCAHGLTHYRKNVKGNNIAITQVVGDRYSNEGKVKYKGRSVTLSDALNWYSYVERHIDVCEKMIFERASEDFDKFHEFTKWTDQISFYATKILAKYGTGLKDAYHNAPSNVKSLYKISSMLKDSLDSTGIYFNPSAAKYGKRRTTDIYRMIHKMVMILEHTEGSAFNKKIRMKGNAHKEYEVYESFKIIPLSFIQNAIKYSSSNEITVRFEELPDYLLISVISTGNALPDDIEQLSQRGYRTPWAKDMHHDGKGLGLYVSNVVARAHSYQIGVKSKLLGYEYEDKPQAENVFYIKVY
ncbi:sensor histidine kinase [Vibrio parahaemolyticus]|nr:sensor histidine kinase [Vibrio parahaemolyticus]EGR1961516.1 sensor histidine kinase [Vibrio parahaemolyticus]EGR1969957.1 sensor histidine kinase [Vibrio parahaemolyticus]